MAGGGKKVVSVATAVFNAAKHAYGALKGFFNAFKGAFDVFKDVYNKVKKFYDDTIGWVHEKFKPLFEAYNKLRELYDKHVKPVLDWAEKTLKVLDASFKVFRGQVWAALETLDKKTLGWIKDLHERVDKVLRTIGDVADAFDRRLAQNIQKIRDEIRQNVIGRINQFERSIYNALDVLWLKVFGRIQTILSWADRYVIQQKKTIDELLDDVDKLLTVKRKPKFTPEMEKAKYMAPVIAEMMGTRLLRASHPNVDEIIEITERPTGEAENPIVEFFAEDIPHDLAYRSLVQDEEEMEKELSGKSKEVVANLWADLTPEEREMWEILELDPTEYWPRFWKLSGWDPRKVVTWEDIEKSPLWAMEQALKRLKLIPERPPKMSWEDYQRYYEYEGPPEGKEWYYWYGYEEPPEGEVWFWKYGYEAPPEEH